MDSKIKIVMVDDRYKFITVSLMCIVTSENFDLKTKINDIKKNYNCFCHARPLPSEVRKYLFTIDFNSIDDYNRFLLEQS